MRKILIQNPSGNLVAARQETKVPPTFKKRKKMKKYNLPSKNWFEDLLVLRDPLPPLPLDLDLNPEEEKRHD